MRHFAAFAFCVALVSTPSLAQVPTSLPSPEALAKAEVRGKYQGLLDKIPVPDDVASYGEFNDWGYWTGTSWAGFTGLPQGYWVYVYPCWYIWARTTAPIEPAPPVIWPPVIHEHPPVIFVPPLPDPEVKALRDEIATLKAELAALREELELLKQQLARKK
jgi:hypothetical protein